LARRAFAFLLLILNVSAALRAAGAPPAATQASSERWPFIPGDDHFFYNALLDLRDLNEEKAGQSGFVHLSPSGEFLRGDGKPIRFWACGSSVFEDDPKGLTVHARFLAKLGVNMVRLHAQISGDGMAPELKEVNHREIDDIWRAVAAFKRVGIYVTISPYWANDRPARNWGIEGYNRESNLYGLLFFNLRLQEGYKAWVRTLYDEPNPYTGIPLAQDPSVAILQVQNEDGMFFWTIDAIKPPQKKLLGRLFAGWLRQRYGSLENAANAWKDAAVEGDDFPAGDVGIAKVWQWTQPQHGGMARRLADQLQFFAKTQRDFYASMVKYYRDDLGCRQLLNASNWITADPQRLNDVERYTNTVADVMAVNKYFNSIHVGPNNGWRVDSADCFVDHPGVLNPWDLPTNLKQAVGHPMIVTETSWVSPMDYQNEGPFLLAAYQSLTGVAACFWFQAMDQRYQDDPRLPMVDAHFQHPLRKWTCSIPALMGNFPAAALMYRSGYLKRGQPVILENRPLEDLWNRRLPLIAERPTFDPNRMSGEPKQDAPSAENADALAYLVGPVLVNYGGEPSQNRIADLSSYIDRQNKIIRSNTGEIRLDYNVGLCTIDAPAAQGASGFLRRAGPIHLGTIDLSCSNEQASILAVSMDGLPLADSRQILIQFGADARLHGWKQEAADFHDDEHRHYHGFRIAAIGQPPWMIEDAGLTLHIRNKHLTKLAALDAVGYLAQQSDLKPEGDGVDVRFPAHAMYAIVR
jgi:hypothetical protein